MSVGAGLRPARVSSAPALAFVAQPLLAVRDRHAQFFSRLQISHCCTLRASQLAPLACSFPLFTHPRTCPAFVIASASPGVIMIREQFRAPLKPSLIIHGGAWNIPDESVEDSRAGIQRALEAGWKILSTGGAAIDAVTSAVVILEDDPTFDAGFGSHLNTDGRVQLDAILMDGATLKAGAVAAVEHIHNPIRLARAVLEHSEHMMLVAGGAEKFAKERGIELCPPEDLIHERERIAWRRCLSDSHAAEHHLG